MHVWGGISHRGATSVCIFTGIMESIGYQTILERNLLPFIKKTYPNGHRLWQDNDPKHTSNSTKDWFIRNGINHWKAPPESPVSCAILESVITVYGKHHLVVAVDKIHLPSDNGHWGT